jgi:tetratricopeptide (TPR) repeat protein
MPFRQAFRPRDAEVDVQKEWLWAIPLVAMTLVAYVPALRGGFVMDDDPFVVENPLLRSLDGLRRIWTQGVPEEHYWPVTYTVLWLEHQLWGSAPAGYHAVNVLLHAANAALLWRVLVRAEAPGAWLAAAVFALHPVHVESTAWVIELKDVLSGLLYLLAFLAYLAVVDGRGWRAYALSLCLFAAAMLSKSAVVALPLAIGLWLWWKRGRLRRVDVARLAAMLGLATVMALADVLLVRRVQDYRSGFSPLERLLVATRALCFYVGKLAWPARLVPIYPRWTVDPGAAWQWLPVVAVVAVVLLVALGRRRLGRGPLAATLCFVATLLPTLGLLDFSFMGRSLVADRFQYLASIAPIALVVFGAAWASDRLAPRLRAVRAAGVAVLVALGLLTWRQASAYTNEETYYDAILAGNPDSFLANYNVANVLARDGRFDEAIRHYEEALRLEPDSAIAHYNLANVLGSRGRADEAIRDYEETLRLEPDLAEAHNNLALLLARRGRLDEAIPHYGEALRLEPGDAEAHNNLGNALARRGQLDEAIAQYEEALRLKPDLVEARSNLAFVRARRRRM